MFSFCSSSSSVPIGVNRDSVETRNYPELFNLDLCGEEFFVEIESERETAKQNAIKYAQEIFPNEELKCLGRVSEFEAECMGLDTY